MATNDTYNFYDQSRLVRIDHVDNFNELINFTRNQASQDDVCEADFGRWLKRILIRMINPKRR